jgi:hypothetical protein
MTSLITDISGNLLAGQRFDAAKLIAKFTEENTKERQRAVTTDAIALEYCYSMLNWCLNNGHYDWAAGMLWGENLFSFKPQCTQRVWKALDKRHAILLQGAASMSKSYGGGVWHFLDWIRDPQYTSIMLVGPSEDHLKSNLFSHLVTLHREASLPMPGIVGDLYIGLDTNNRKSAIRGVVIPLGKRQAGRLQGAKRVPRKKPHPIFGMLSRVRIFIDEFEKVPVGIHKDIDNVLSNFDGDPHGFKITTAYNPEDASGQVAERAEPVTGWEGFDPEKDYEWESKRGWYVVRLDAKTSENVVAGKTLFQGLQTVEGYNLIIKNAGGIDTPGYWTMCRACFPRSGSTYTVMSLAMVHQMKGEFIWAGDPTPCGGVDMALEGGDAAEFAYGLYGKASGYKQPPGLDNPTGKTVMFEDASGQRVLRNAVQLNGVDPLPTGDTVKMAEATRAKAVELHIAPKDLGLDRTGNGAGVHDLLKALWSQEVRGYNYSSAATEKKILEEDTKTAKEEFERLASELWFATKKFSVFGFLRAKASALSEELVKQLTGRRYKAGKQNKVEEKPDYMARGNQSPNKADAVTILVHTARMSSGMLPSATAECAGTSVGGDSGQAPVPCRVDCTSRYEDLDTGGEEMPAGFSY